MSLIQGKWIEDGAISSTKLASDSTFIMAGARVNGPIGIRTEPVDDLHIYADSSATVRLQSNVGNTYQVRSDSTGNFVVRDIDALADRITLSPDGNLGLNISGPQDLLHLQSSSADVDATVGLRLDMSDGTAGQFQMNTDHAGAFNIVDIRNDAKRVSIDKNGVTTVLSNLVSATQFTATVNSGSTNEIVGQFIGSTDVGAPNTKVQIVAGVNTDQSTSASLEVINDAMTFGVIQHGGHETDIRAGIPVANMKEIKGTYQYPLSGLGGPIMISNDQPNPIHLAPNASAIRPVLTAIDGFIGINDATPVSTLSVSAGNAYLDAGISVRPDSSSDESRSSSVLLGTVENEFRFIHHGKNETGNRAGVLLSNLNEITTGPSTYEQGPILMATESDMPVYISAGQGFWPTLAVTPERLSINNPNPPDPDISPDPIVFDAHGFYDKDTTAIIRTSYLDSGDNNVRLNMISSDATVSIIQHGVSETGNITDVIPKAGATEISSTGPMVIKSSNSTNAYITAQGSFKPAITVGFEKVGINNTSPERTLDVDGDIKVSGLVHYPGMSAAPSSTGSAPNFTDCFGGINKALGEPVGWLRVFVGSTYYKMPLYHD